MGLGVSEEQEVGRALFMENENKGVFSLGVSPASFLSRRSEAALVHRQVKGKSYLVTQ